MWWHGPYVSDIFKKDAMALIYSSFPSIECFELQANKCLEQYISFPSASACIRKIVKEKKKVCREYTDNEVWTPSKWISFINWMFLNQVDASLVTTWPRREEKALTTASRRRA